MASSFGAGRAVSATSLGGIGDGLARRSPLTAMRAEPLLAASLVLAAGLAWWSASARMAGMDEGPGTALGSLGSFTALWATMMAAMMLPSLAPAAATFAGAAGRRPDRLVLFVGGYLLVWSAAGLGAYGLYELARGALGVSLSWDGGGRWLAAGVLGLATLYQLTPLKRTFLSRCRGPLRAAAGATRSASLAAGVSGGGWCLGCSWALMAALFALGVMSLTWMAAIAVLVALEKLGPSASGARLATAGVLAALALGVLAAPHDVPGLVLPGSSASPHAMKAMG